MENKYAKIASEHSKDAFADFYMDNVALSNREDALTIANSEWWDGDIYRLEGSSSVMDCWMAWYSAVEYTKHVVADRIAQLSTSEL